MRRGERRKTRFGPAPPRPRPRVGIVSPYLHRKGLTTLARSIESALDGGAAVFPVRKLARLDGEFERVKAQRVDADLRHERVARPGTRLLDWLAPLDVAVLVERPFPRLCDHCRAHGVRTIVVALPDWLPPEREERAEGLNHADACVVYSAANARSLRADGVERVHFIPPSVDWEIQAPRPPGDPCVFYFNVGVAGAFDRRNVPLVLDTFRDLLPKHPDVRLVVKFHPMARKYVRDLGPLPERVRVVDDELPLAEMVSLQGEADVSLFPSRFEGLGLPLLESLHAGVPVIATDGPPMNEIIRDGENGLLVRALYAGDFGAQTFWKLDAEHFRAQVERVMSDASLRAALKAGATKGLAERAAAFRQGWIDRVRQLGPRVLNLGAGEDRREGAINLDIRAIPGVDAVATAERLPFADDSIDELCAQDLLEHFPSRQTGALLDEWVRVIRPGGLLRVQTPDLRALADRLRSGKLDIDRVVEWIYGAQDHPYNFHQTGFDESRLRALLEARGVRGLVRVREGVSSKNVCLEGRVGDAAS